LEIKTEQEKLWRNFLLGNVSDAEREAIEDSFLTDEESFAALEIVEDELIEDYLRGDLSGAERKLFEAAFLQTAARRERVSRMKMLLDEASARKRAAVSPTEKTSFGESLTAFFKKWQTAFAAFAFVLFAALVAWLFIRQSEKTPEIVKNEPELKSSPANVSSPETNAPVNSNLFAANEDKSNSAAKPTPQPTPKKQPSPKSETTLAFFILKPGGIRGGASENRLSVAPQTNQIALRLDLESNNYTFYTARVTTIDGATVFTSARLKSNKKSVLLQLPIRKLPRGDYIVELSGINPEGQSESVNDYAFTLQK
jgi:hypothetical protein